MKNTVRKLVVFALLFAFALSLFAGCGYDEHEEEIKQARREKLAELIARGMDEAEAIDWLDSHEDQWHPDHIGKNGDESEDEDDTTGETEKQTDAVTEPQGLTADRIIGTYIVTGTKKWTDYKDPGDSNEGTIPEFVMTVTPGEGDTIVIVSESMTLNETVPYDPVSGTAGFTDSLGTLMTVKFTESGGRISMEMTARLENDNGLAEEFYTGVRG